MGHSVHSRPENRSRYRRVTGRHKALENSEPAQATRRRNREPPAQAHGGRGQARTHAGERAGARHGTAVSRVPGGPQTGQSGSPAFHVQPERADLRSEGGASGSDPRDSYGLADTLLEVESKPRRRSGSAQPASGEERGLHLEAPPPREATPPLHKPHPG